MDAVEIANILAKELWLHQLASLEGLQSGVPTRTTATLTPTTLRNIEQTLIELQCRPEQHASQAGFVPPPIHHHQGQLSSASVSSYSSDSMALTQPLHVSPGPASSSGDSSSSPGLPPPRRRNGGGRRPANGGQKLSPEEEERRKLRRERNKMAAARCRKRRLDHTMELEEETEGLERKKLSLTKEIEDLQKQTKALEFTLERHERICLLNRRSPPDIKPSFDAGRRTAQNVEPYNLPLPDGVRVKVEVMDDTAINMDNDGVFTSYSNMRTMLTSAGPLLTPAPVPAAPCNAGPLTTPTTEFPVRPNRFPTRPQTLKLPPMKNTLGIDISTPSNGLQPFNFDSLMEGGTGLTPVQPCATQQHRIIPEIVSPESANNTKLVSL